MVRINRSVSRLSYGVAMQAKQYEVTRVQAVDGEAFPQTFYAYWPLLKKTYPPLLSSFRAWSFSQFERCCPNLPIRPPRPHKSYIGLHSYFLFVCDSQLSTD